MERAIEGPSPVMVFASKINIEDEEMGEEVDFKIEIKNGMSRLIFDANDGDIIRYGWYLNDGNENDPVYYFIIMNGDGYECLTVGDLEQLAHHINPQIFV